MARKRCHNRDSADDHKEHWPFGPMRDQPGRCFCIMPKGLCRSDAQVERDAVAFPRNKER